MDFIITSGAAWYIRLYRRISGAMYTTRKAIARKVKLMFYKPRRGKKPLTR